MTTRRGLLQGAAAVGAALGFSAFIGAARAADPFVITTPQVFDPTFIDMMNAYSGGHFAKEGLDAKVLGPPGSAAAMELVLGGQAQFGYIASPDFIRAVGARSAPLMAIASLGQRIGFRIVSLAEKPMRTGTDLKGKTIGVISVGGLSEALVDVVMIRAGVDPKDSTRVVTGNSPGEVELIRRGRIDCFICNFQLAVTLQRSGQALEYLDIDKVLQAPGGLYYTSNELIQAKPGVVQRALRALRSSVQEINTQPLEPIFLRAAKDFDIPRMKDLDTLVAVQHEVSQKLWLAEGEANLFRNLPLLWEKGVEGMRQVGIIGAGNAANFYTNRFVDGLGKA
jgi:NitT/TauT family transport system substrate-binding protein